MDQVTSNKTNQHISRWLFMPFSSNLHARNIAAALLRAEVLSACCRHSSAVLWFGRGAGALSLLEALGSLSPNPKHSETCMLEAKLNGQH